jgi:type II secretory pathway component PulC
MRPAVLRALFLIVPLGFGLTLAWQEWQFRQLQRSAVQASPAPANTLAPRTPLNTLAVATVLGMSAQDSALNSTEPLTLRATMVASDRDSRALLAGPEGERFYRTGERLPGGSLLRRIEPAQVVLWRQGREERLHLHPASERFLQAARAHGQAAPTLHLRPTVEPPRSE